MSQTWALISDTHCGSPVGLTPYPQNPIQKRIFETWIDCIGWFGKRPDVVVHLGDISEGVNIKLDIDDSRLVSQYEKSVTSLVMWGAVREYILLTGTRIHTHLQEQQLEEFAASMIREKHREIWNENVQVTILRKLNTRINGWFHMQGRHKVSRSIIPHGRATGPLRSLMWEVLNKALKAHYEKTGAKWADLLIWGHVHYYLFAQNSWGSVMTLPGWKAYGDKYGDEECDGSIDIGVIRLIIGETEEEGWSHQARTYHAAMVSRLVDR